MQSWVCTEASNQVGCGDLSATPPVLLEAAAAYASAWRAATHISSCAALAASFFALWYSVPTRSASFCLRASPVGPRSPSSVLLTGTTAARAAPKAAPAAAQTRGRSLSIDPACPVICLRTRGATRRLMRMRSARSSTHPAPIKTPATGFRRTASSSGPRKIPSVWCVESFIQPVRPSLRRTSGLVSCSHETNSARLTRVPAESGVECPQKHQAECFIISAGTLPPFSASFVITCLCSQMFICAEPSSAPV